MILKCPPKAGVLPNPGPSTLSHARQEEQIYRIYLLLGREIFSVILCFAQFVYRTRKLPKSARTLLCVDSSLSDNKNLKVNVMVPRSKVTEPFHAHAHLPLMHSTATNWPWWHQHLWHRRDDKNPKVKVMAPRSKVAGPQFHAHAHLLLMGSQQARIGHFSSIHSSVHKISKVKIMAPRSKVIGSKFHAHVKSFMGSPDTDWAKWHQFLGHNSIYKISRVIALRSKATGPKCHAHEHLPLVSSLYAQTGYNGINTLDTGGSTRFPSLKVIALRSKVAEPNSMPMHIYTS